MLNISNMFRSKLCWTIYIREKVNNFTADIYLLFLISKLKVFYLLNIQNF